MAASDMASASASSACDNNDLGTISTGAVDSAALAAVKTVTVLTVDNCNGAGNMAALDGSAVASLSSNPAVTAALTANGYAGTQIVGYMMDGGSLTVYVRGSK